jgi:hypothetical protein
MHKINYHKSNYLNHKLYNFKNNYHSFINSKKISSINNSYKLSLKQLLNNNLIILSNLSSKIYNSKFKH